MNELIFKMLLNEAQLKELLLGKNVHLGIKGKVSVNIGILRIEIDEIIKFLEHENKDRTD